MSPNADKGTQLEILLRSWLDDDDACDVALWITSEPEAVAEAAYQASPYRQVRTMTQNADYEGRRVEVLNQEYQSVVLLDGQRVAAFWLPEDRIRWAEDYAAALGRRLSPSGSTGTDA